MGKGEQRILLLTKLEPPQSNPTILQRSALLSALQKNRKKKLILICAGAGYGKTTLISQFIIRKNMQYMYYQLDEDDADPATFISYLLKGLQNIRPGFGRKINRLSQFFNNFARYRDIIIGTLLNEVIERFKSDVYIILEDYHTLKQPEAIDATIDYLLDHLPPKLHIIITSRMLPGLSLSKLRARGALFEMTTPHLRFSREEIQLFFKKVYQQPLKAKEIQWIEQHSEGWPTSLRLMMQSSEYLEGIKSSRYVREILDNYYQSQSSLFNYFAQEIFNAESGTIQQFLVDCSLFDWLTPGLCDAITGRRSCSQLLSRLTRRNAFLFKIQNRGYRFHHLYQEFLRSKLTNVQRERVLYRRAAAYFSRQDSHEDALKYFIKGEHYKRVCALVIRIGYSMIRQGRSSVLCSYVESIPARLRNNNASVLIMYAQTLIHMGRAEEARSSLMRAIRLLKRSKGRRVNHADALYELGGIYLNQDKYLEARRYFLRALKVCPTRTYLTRAAILNSLGFVNSTLSGRYRTQAEKYFRQAYRSAQKIKYGELQASVLNNWALHDWKKGEIHPAYQKLTDMVKILKTHYSPHCGAGYFNGARLCLLLGKTREAQEILDSGSRLCAQFNDQWSMATIWKGYGLLYRNLGEYEKAKTYLIRSLKVYEELSIIRLAITSLNELCRVHTALGEYTDAERNLSAIWWFKKNKQDSEAINILITEGRLRTAQRKYDQSALVLHNVLDLASRFGHCLHLFRAHVELSKVYYHKDMASQALAHVKKAVLLGRSKGYEYLLGMVLKRNPWMRSFLIHERYEYEYISTLLRDSLQYMYCIDVTMFGKPMIKVDENQVLASMWKTRKAEQLFYYLLLRGEQATENDHLIEVFWPGSGKKTGHYNLRKTIQYIRQTLELLDDSLRDIIQARKGVYSLAPETEIVTDIAKFEHTVKRLRADTLKNENRTRLIDTGLELYRGDFAVGWYDNWVEEKRRYYRNLYEELLAMKAAQCMEQRKYRDALQYYKDLIDLNIFEESYHRNYMTACAKCRRHEDIIHDYTKLVQVLKKDLNKTPEPETTRLYAALLKKS
jgi:ATP/maltotriose-dependent transcriptional regulator MalT/two-component SAPR family response regulator